MMTDFSSDPIMSMTAAADKFVPCKYSYEAISKLSTIAYDDPNFNNRPCTEDYLYLFGVWDELSFDEIKRYPGVCLFTEDPDSDHVIDTLASYGREVHYLSNNNYLLRA